MSTKSAPYYWLECDEPECSARCPDTGDDYMAYAEEDQAMENADASEWSIDHNDTGNDYCPEHVPDIGPGDEE